MDLSPPHLKSLPAWTPWRDELAQADARVRQRMRFLFTPIRAPTLSAAGARAGLGPDGVTGAERPQTDGVDTRPDPRLDVPIAARLMDDIGEAAQMAEAERMGVNVPVEAPQLSANGKNAGLGAFGASSSSPRAVGAASVRELAMSRSKVSMAGRKATAMVSRPVPAISDASGRRGITGRNPIRAAGAGFAMRVPKGPVAQDRERWKSGTTDRISAASKGLNLANMDWGDHRGAPPKPQPKRTWVGKQGDASENPDDRATCAELAIAPHGAVNKGAPLRELEKETVPSDVCPPLTSSIGTLEAILRRDARMLDTAPMELMRLWAARPSIPGGRSALRGGTRSFTSRPDAMVGITSPAGGSGCGCSDCGCKETAKPKNGSDCGCKGGKPKNGASDCACDGTSKPKNGTGRENGLDLRALVASVATRRGRDPNAEWFVPVFQRGGRTVLGTEQRGPSSTAWHPNPHLGMRPGDSLVATIHTHSRSPRFSQEDRAAGNALGVPMVLVTPGGERARVYDPASGSTRELPFSGGNDEPWSLIGRSMHAAPNGQAGVHRRGVPVPNARGMRREPNAGVGPITISDYEERTFGPSVSKLSVVRTVVTGTSPMTQILEDRLVREIVEQALDHPDPPNSAEAIWLRVAVAVAKWPKPPRAIPDADLFRALVAVARRRGEAIRYNAGLALELATKEPLHVEPALLERIIAHSALVAAPSRWASAWSERVAMGAPLPTPPDKDLLDAINTAVFASRFRGSALSGADAQTILEAAHRMLPRPDPSAPAVWPPYIATDFLKWVVYFAVHHPNAGNEEVRAAAEYMFKLSGAAQAPAQVPDAAFLALLVRRARQADDKARVLDIRNLALADRLTEELLIPVVRSLATPPASAAQPARTSTPSPTCTLVSSSLISTEVSGIDELILAGHYGIVEHGCIWLLSSLSAALPILDTVGDILDLIAVFEHALELTAQSLGFTPCLAVHLRELTYRCTDGTTYTERKWYCGCPGTQGLVCSREGDECGLYGFGRGCCPGLHCYARPFGGDPTADPTFGTDEGVCYPPAAPGKCFGHGHPCDNNQVCCSQDCYRNVCEGDTPYVSPPPPPPPKPQPPVCSPDGSYCSPQIHSCCGTCIDFRCEGEVKQDPREGFGPGGCADCN